MKQVQRNDALPTETRQHTSIRLDPLTDARLSYIKAFYLGQGEDLSTSIIVRRAISNLEAHLSRLCSCPFPRDINAEMAQVLSGTTNKPDKFEGEYPWPSVQGYGIISPFSMYLRKF